MDRSPYWLLRIVLLIVAVPPLVFGLAAAISGDFVVKIAGVFSRAAIVLTPEIDYLLKPLGLYVLMFGALMAYAAVDPVKNRVIITWGGVVLFLRAVQRLVLTAELSDLFLIPVGLNLVHVAYLASLSLVLLLLRPKRV